MEINKGRVILELRCQRCGAFFEKEVDAFGFDVSDTLMFYVKKWFIHPCSDVASGVAKVRGGHYKCE